MRFKAQIFQALSDPARLEILAFLRGEEKCVCEIVPHQNLIQPVSRHLKILKDAGIVRCRKDGTTRIYAAIDARVNDAVDALTPELVVVLQREVIAQMSCNQIEEK